VADIRAFVSAAESAGGLLDPTAECPPVSHLLAGSVLHSAPLARWIGQVYATLRQHRPTMIPQTPATPDGIELHVLDVDPWEASLLTIRLLQAQAVSLKHEISLPNADAIAAAAKRRREARTRLDQLNANRQTALLNAQNLLFYFECTLTSATNYDGNPVIPPEQRSSVADALLALWAGLRVERIEVALLIDSIENQARLVGGDTSRYVVHLARWGLNGDRQGILDLLAELDKLPARPDPDAPVEPSQKAVWDAFVARLRGLLDWGSVGRYLPDGEEGSRLAQELSPPLPAEVPPIGAVSEEAEGDKHIETQFRFGQDGAVWRIQFGDESGLISDNEFTGLGYLARLLSRPHERISADELCGLGPLPSDTSSPDSTFDPTGAASVRREMNRLKEDIEEAAASGALARVEELGAELQRLKDSHNKDKAKRGKARRLKQTPLEKAAERVRKAIGVVKAELRKRNMPKLAAHLDRIVKETTSFAYRPEKPEPPWRISL
jgi:hypothetical protein